MDQPSELLKYLNNTVPCYALMIYDENGIWKGSNPLINLLPLFIIQLTIVILVTRLFLLVLEPFQQPRFTAQIIGGLFLGPSGLGRLTSFTNKFFPPASFMVLDPLANFALIHYAFLVGLEMNLTSILRTEQKALTVAIAGFLLPVAVGVGLFFMFGHSGNTNFGFIFWAACLTVTGHSTLVQILKMLKILETEIGERALSSALIDDLCSWFALALALALSGEKSVIHWSLLCTTAFVLFCVYYIRPALLWWLRRNPEGKAYSEFTLCCFLAGVGIAGVITDACGTHPITGAFVFGLIIPKGELEGALVDRLEQFVMEIMMPLFFATCGHRVDVDCIISDTSWVKVLFVIVLACSAKVLSTLFSCFLCDMPFQEGLSLGVLMNTKSLLAMVMLYVGMEHQVLTTQTYSIMVIAILAMTMIVTPVMIANQCETMFVPYKRRTIQRTKSNEELRILTCVHTIRNVPAIINLLEASNATKESHIQIFSLHLVELIGRASAMRLVQHTPHKMSKYPTSTTHSETDQIMNTFESYTRRHDFVSFEPLVLRSSYTSMGEDICWVAEEKRVALIIIPFHKQQSLVGEMEDIKPVIRDVNEIVLANSPCSVGILIDRGLADSGDFATRIAMLYFGGPDDREALSYAWRMATHPDIHLKIVKFNFNGNIGGTNMGHLDFIDETRGDLSVNIDSGTTQKQLDEVFLSRFRNAIVNDETIEYTEMLLDNEEDTVNAITEMDHKHDLYVVGRGRGVTTSPLTAGLEDWCECPELGAVGDVLVTSKFSSAFSVLVVHKYGVLGPSPSVDGSEKTSSMIRRSNVCQSMEWPRSSVGEGSNFSSFVSRRGETVDDY